MPTPRSCQVPALLAILLATLASPPAHAEHSAEHSTEHRTKTARPTDPFRVAGKPPTAIHAARTAEPLDPDFARSPMLAALSGQLAALTPQDLVKLRRALGNAVPEPDLADATTLGVLHMKRGAQTARAEILALPDDTYAVRALDVPGATTRSLDANAIEYLAIDRWSDSAEPLAPGTRTNFVGNADPALITLDRATRRRVFRANYPELTRDLADETIHIRTPRDFDPSAPLGILVWVSPTPDGRIPPMFEPALDSLNLVAVGASNAGNQRPLSDRLQLMLDAIETARQRMTLDESRIYVTGMSGGGRCSSILQIAMPETFAGAVPIVGLDSYHLVPTGNGNAKWPARQGRPPTKVFAVLKQRRIRAITGDQDFNEPEMVRRTKMMQADGIHIEIDVIPGMAHVMPTPDQFTLALDWVDEPRQTEILTATEAAAQALAAIDPAASQADQRAALIEVTRLAPWSDPAWQAAERLGFDKPN